LTCLKGSAIFAWRSRVYEQTSSGRDHLKKYSGKKSGNVRIGWILAATLSLLDLSAAQRVKLEPDQQYVLLETVRTKTLAAEVNEVALKGFRVKMAQADSESGRMELLMERTATPPDVFEYQLVATMSSKTKEKEMNAAAAQGFRVIPHTFMAKKGMTIFNTESVVLMEKTPKSTKAYEYKMITGLRTATLEREIKGAVKDGWELIDLAYGELILERVKPEK